jgi:hypothetical protein
MCPEGVMIRLKAADGSLLTDGAYKLIIKPAIRQDHLLNSIFHLLLKNIKKREQNGCYLYNGVCKTIEYHPLSYVFVIPMVHSIEKIRIFALVYVSFRLQQSILINIFKNSYEKNFYFDRCCVSLHHG